MGDHQGVSAAEQGPTERILKGPVQLRESFFFRTLVVGDFPGPLSDGGSGVINPDPSTRCVPGAAEEGGGESRVPSVDAGDRQGMLFPH